MATSAIKCPSVEVDFIDVLDEPCHKPVIRNPRVNVFVAKIARNNTTIYHRHKEDTVNVVIAGSRCRTQILGSNALHKEYTTGDCFAAEHRLKPMIHRVECLNESPSDAWFVGAEILQSKPFASESVLQHTQYSHISKINIPGCRAYRLKLIPDETTGYRLLNFSGVFISIANSQLEINSGELDRYFPLSSGAIERGYVTWFDGPVWLEIKNKGSIIYEAILLELA